MRTADAEVAAHAEPRSWTVVCNSSNEYVVLYTKELGNVLPSYLTVVESGMSYPDALDLSNRLNAADEVHKS